MSLLAIILGLAFTLILGYFIVDHVLEKIDAEVKRQMVTIPHPPPVPQNIWEEEMLGAKHGGEQLGHLERFIFFAAFVMDGGWVIAASWLAFKVAFKWESWGQLKEIASYLQDKEHLETIRALTYRVQRANRRFIIGTALNVAIGLVGAGIASYLS
jgi:hypothetical protein